MRAFLVYLFWPNPANATYASPKAWMLLIVCVGLILASVGIRLWRGRLENSVLRKLSRSWATAALWFGISGCVLVIARVEQIQFLSMRFLWVVWILLAALYVLLHIRIFRSRYYEVLPAVAEDDPREKYLPRKKWAR